MWCSPGAGRIRLVPVDFSDIRLALSGFSGVYFSASGASGEEGGVTRDRTRALNIKLCRPVPGHVSEYSEGGL